MSWLIGILSLLLLPFLHELAARTTGMIQARSRTLGGLLVALAGPTALYVIAAFFAFLALRWWGMPATSRQQAVTQIVPGSPAERAGLAPGDVIISIGGEPVDVDHPAPAALARSGGKTTEMRIRRGEREQTFSVTPIADAGKFRIGILLQPAVIHRPVSVIEAVREGARFPALRTGEIAAAMADMARGRVREGVVAGPVAIVRATASAPGPQERMVLMASLAVSAMLFSLCVPIPPFAGGRILVTLYRAVRPASRRT
jgi:regulator of sigma E protease